ncbi:phage holin family protein [Paracoccus laeviglucosivorans]|uniref:Holin-X, holin superfamily III n=1 Tax=Paracoccus laeviglucosivorans TaxID=1197861 RepID=A0A521BVD9_9RHOB|nr:phage holin family protein [Paracoccus laeviglucosivorans]SMO50380.1 Putative Holin-X, holin superfamily III [Paracoccus laeviglucosivorans]
MFAYARNMQLALTDKLRRVGLASGAGVAMLLGAGFLLAALWTYLAHHLGWGSMNASLAMGGVLVLIGVILLMMARKERHRAPSSEELRTEVQEQLNLLANTAVTRVSDAADAALGRVSAKADEFMGKAENRAHSLADDLSYRANRMADHAEARVYSATRHIGEDTVRKLGIPPQIVSLAGRKLGAARDGGIGTYAPLLGAFAVGITLASRLQDWRHRDDDADDDFDDGYDDWNDDDQTWHR